MGSSVGDETKPYGTYKGSMVLTANPIASMTKEDSRIYLPRIDAYYANGSGSYFALKADVTEFIKAKKAEGATEAVLVLVMGDFGNIFTEKSITNVQALFNSPSSGSTSNIWVDMVPTLHWK